MNESLESVYIYIQVFRFTSLHAKKDEAKNVVEKIFQLAKVPIQRTKLANPDHHYLYGLEHKFKIRIYYFI